jgi:hypothetical protein
MMTDKTHYPPDVPLRLKVGGRGQDRHAAGVEQSRDGLNDPGIKD